ncbi:MAG: hypothetical protein ABSD75_15005 [Terriglobales bacterium]|jgi:hypothetical protein
MVRRFDVLSARYPLSGRARADQSPAVGPARDGDPSTSHPDQTGGIAPGIYAVYDYTGDTDFHSHILPRRISIFEDGRPAVQVHVDSLADAPDLDPSLFEPTQEMADTGGTFKLASPKRFPMRVDPSDGATSRFYQLVIVHAILDAQDGTVIDAEPLQTSDRNLTRAAIELVKSSAFEPSGFQQEAFIHVQFHMPAARPGGPPVSHSAVRWVDLDRRARVRLNRPPHAGK